QRVEDHLKWDARLDASDIRVNVDHGRVTLSGTVPTMRSQQVAERDVTVVPDVVSVENRITVEHAATTVQVEDELVRNAIRDLMRSSPDLNARNIKVRVDRGKVYLEGSVDSYWKRKYAEDIASEAPGVVSIENRIEVTPWGDFTDQDILDDVIASINRNTSATSGDVKVSVQDRVVTLTGIVADWDSYNAVMQAAENTKGVRDVIDHLSVEVPPRREGEIK
ncbi:MAG TPA: BON domain-containing protein, partial [Methanomicrobiales archaeon]|nr:BON domain-containing protein [Methanomicrobiales archaeon]